VRRIFVDNLVSLPGIVGVPVVKKRVLGDWMVSFYEEFEHLLFPDDVLHNEIEALKDYALSQNLSKGFRREVVVKAFPFLCAIRPEERGIYIGTRRLSRELALLKLHDVAPVLNDKEVDKHFFKLKDHIEKMSALSSSFFPSELEWASAKYNLPDLMTKSDWSEVDEGTSVLLKQLISKVGDYRSTLFEKVSDYGLSLTAQYDLIRIHLLKFLALLPSLDHDKAGIEVKKNLSETMRRQLIE